MNWNNLRKNKCPKCGEQELERHGGKLSCPDNECGFFCRERVAEDILFDMDRKAEQPEI